MYVGITRARRRLVLSRAWYYRDNIGAKEPSPFWEEALATGLVDEAASIDCPPDEPAPLGAELRSPTRPRRSSDPHADQRRRSSSRPSSSACASWRRKQPPVPEWRAPSTLSVTAFLTFVRDPEEFFWRYVRRSPPRPRRPPSSAPSSTGESSNTHGSRAALGGVVEEAEEPYDLDLGERRGGAKPVTAESCGRTSSAAGSQP